MYLFKAAEAVEMLRSVYCNKVGENYNLIKQIRIL